MDPLNGVLPWTRSCFVCGESNPHGLQLKSRLEDGKVVIRYTTRDRDVGYRQVVHGGIMMTLLDEVMTWAAIVSMKQVCVAADLRCRLKKPILVGQELRIEGWTERVARKLCKTSGVVQDKDGTVYMTSEGTYMPMPAEHAQLAEKDFVPGSDIRHEDLL